MNDDTPECFTSYGDGGWDYTWESDTVFIEGYFLMIYFAQIVHLAIYKGEVSKRNL